PQPSTRESSGLHGLWMEKHQCCTNLLLVLYKAPMAPRRFMGFHLHFIGGPP
ncbi:hypothetical protein HAX54_022234, partial [Datura stramonium]|nr:hypothetical protein [Datura stramonium]